MSGTDDKDRGGDLVQFPRVVMPSALLDAPGPDAEPSVEDEPSDRQPGVWPTLPNVSEMGPPLALMMPALSAPGADVEDEEGDGFVPPQPEDPASPSVRDMVALAMALVTAMGVAAAQGLWHRARRRQALADHARASADKATHKAAAGHGSKGAKQSEGASLLRSLGGKGARPGGKNRPPKGPHGDSRKGPGRDRDKAGKAPKADRDGKRWGRDELGRRKDRDRKRRKDDKGKAPKKPKGGTAPTTPSPKAPKPPKKQGGKLRWKAPKRRPGKGPAGSKRWTAGRPKGVGKAAKKGKRPGEKRVGKLTWKAPKRRPGPGGGKAITGRKRWSRGTDTLAFKRSRKAWSRRTWKRGRKWVKRWTLRHRAAAARPPRTSWAWKSFKHRHGQRRASWSRRRPGHGMPGSSGPYTPPPPPPPGSYWGMRPPPGTDHNDARVTVERVDEQRPGSSEPKPVPVLAGAPVGGRPALPAGPAPSSAPQSMGARSMNLPSTASTQYRDADLTIYDVIDADADMAEEITDGVVEARRTADGCELLLARLEALHAKIVELKVPGILESMVVRLMDKTATVRARALAIADRLPLASEAIAIAGANAAARHRPLADAVRDAGHIRPAERDYHNE
ncbi:hypothetical protein [Nonomuraea sp. NPDC049646]|uniref:hypothetical protein n=1 Tax=unclassified Nonomuraea TaxID=2593643 RepID=UPI003794A625